MAFDIPQQGSVTSKNVWDDEKEKNLKNPDVITDFTQFWKINVVLMMLKMSSDV